MSASKSLRAGAFALARSRGFTLVEVMVALIVIAIGTLGIAKMQALSLSNTGASRTRALAAIEAASLAEAMHANRAYWASYSSTPGTVSVSTTDGVPTVTSNSATLQSALTTVAGTTCATGTMFGANLSCYCNASPTLCAGTYVNMAASDLYDWGQGLGSLLPSASATVACNNGNNGTNADNPVDCTITISWTENSVALTTQEASAAAAATAAIQTVKYILYVVP
jgi:type IV pilus assembly protein PilV